MDCASESKGNYLLQPFDFLFLSGTFSSEISVIFIDAVADRLAPGDCLEKATAQRFDLIITSIIDRTWHDDLSFLKLLRHQHPDTPILAFGDALIEDTNVAEVEKYADGVIPSSYTFDPSVLNEWTRAEIRNKKFQIGLRGEKAAPVQKKALPARKIFPRHELFLNPAYRWPFGTFKRYSTVTIVWGCPYTCSYCTCATMPVYHRTAEDVLDEVTNLGQLGVKEIYFGDKSFGAVRDITMRVLEGIIARKLDISWSSYFHPNQYTPELLDLMHRSGCHTIIVGIESANLKSLARYKRNVNVEKVGALINHANRIGLNVCGDFMLGLLDEGEREIAETINFALKLKLDYASFNIVSPLPGSVIKSTAIQDGRMHADDHHYDSVGKDRILSSNSMSAQRLEQLRNSAVRRFYLRPSYLMKRVSRLRGMQHFEIQVAEMVGLLTKSASLRP